MSEGHLPEGTRLPPVKVCEKCGQNTAHLEWTSDFSKWYKCNRTACMHIEKVEEGLEE